MNNPGAPDAFELNPVPQGEIYIPPCGPPQGPGPSKAIYGAMGEENIYSMVEDFYAVLETTPIRHLFPEDMKAASRKNAAFLIGITGGPPLYRQLYGDPMMRRRHLHIPIDEEARQTWLTAFKSVLEHAPDKYNFPREHVEGFTRWLEEFSAWMVNKK